MYNKCRIRKWLQIALMVVPIIILSGCNSIFVDVDMPANSGQSHVSGITQEIKQTFQDIEASFVEFWHTLTSKRPVYTPTRPASTEPFTFPPEPSKPPVCPIFDKTLGEIVAYEDKLYFDDGSYQEAACVSTYARTPFDYYDEMHTEFVRAFGYEPSSNSSITFENAGQFYIDGEDYVPIYKIFLRDLGDVVHFYDGEFNTLEEAFHDNGIISICYDIKCELWANGDSFDGDSDCWNDLDEFLKTDEWLETIDQMLQKMADLTGQTRDEFETEDTMYNVAEINFMFIPKACNSQNEFFSIIHIIYRYTPPSSDSF